VTSCNAGSRTLHLLEVQKHLFEHQLHSVAVQEHDRWRQANPEGFDRVASHELYQVLRCELVLLDKVKP
jgi:hypothetical protein